MKYVVEETTGAWIVRRNGEELARFDDQLEALAYIANVLRARAQIDATYSLAMRYLARA